MDLRTRTRTGLHGKVQDIHFLGILNTMAVDHRYRRLFITIFTTINTVRLAQVAEIVSDDTLAGIIPLHINKSQPIRPIIPDCTYAYLHILRHKHHFTCNVTVAFLLLRHFFNS
jgi:hypothetical protein